MQSWNKSKQWQSLHDKDYLLAFLKRRVLKLLEKQFGSFLSARSIRALICLAISSSSSSSSSSHLLKFIEFVLESSFQC